jgi:hypothetical protein
MKIFWTILFLLISSVVYADTCFFVGSSYVCLPNTFTGNIGVSGNLGVGTTHPIVILDISSTNSALRVTRLTNASSIQARNGMIAYDSNENQLQAYVNGTWVSFIATGSGVTNVTGTSPISSSGGTTPAISIANAAADGTTKGAATFVAADFNATTGSISIDYTNGQAASGANKGFLTSADWTTFNGKAPANADYIVGTGTTALSAEQSLGLLTTGLLLNTSSAGTGTVSQYAGTSCTNQFPRSLNASGSATCADVTLTTDTAGNYVGTVADGTGIDGTASGEGATYTPTLDLTEISSATLGAGAFTTLTFDAGATDPIFTFASNKFGITSADNVGIGTTTPRGLLELSSTTNALKLVMASGNVGIGYTLPASSLAVNGKIGIGISNAVDSLIVNSGNVGIGYTVPGTVLAVNGNVGIGVSVAANRLIVSGGNVGIGITAPTATLQLSSTLVNGNALTIVRNYGNVGIGTTLVNALLELSGSTSTTPALVVTQGNVGIGKSAPSQALVVNGNIETTSTNVTIGSCGTGSPTVTGTNVSGSFTTGSGASTSCVITFATPNFTNTPACTVNPRATGVTPRVSAVSTTSFTATYTSGSSLVMDYICMGRQ